MVAAGLNGDSTDDLVVGDYGSNKVSALTKTWPLRGGAAFQPYVESDQGTGAEVARLALGDLKPSTCASTPSDRQSRRRRR